MGLARRALPLLVRDRMTITSDAGVLGTAALAGRFALEHLAVLGDAVTLAVGNGGFGAGSLVLSGSPGEVVTADLDVIVGEFTELVVVHTEELSLLRCAKLEAGNLVDNESEDGGDDEGVGGDGDDVSNLLVDCGSLTGDGTSGKSVVDTVKTDDVVGTEDAVEEKAPHSSDTVLSEHIEGIVDLDPELD